MEPISSSYQDLFTCLPLSHITKDDLDNLINFEPAHEKSGFLASYIKRAAFEEESANRMRTFIVKDVSTEEIIGYFSLKAGMLSRDVPENVSIDEEFYTLPGIELANFAVNGAYKKNHPEARGLGTLLFRGYILPIVQSVSKFIGVYALYIFALPNPSLIDHYNKEFGFNRLPAEEELHLHNRIKPHYDKDCIFMYLVL